MNQCCNGKNANATSDYWHLSLSDVILKMFCTLPFIQLHHQSLRNKFYIRFLGWPRNGIVNLLPWLISIQHWPRRHDGIFSMCTSFNNSFWILNWGPCDCSLNANTAWGHGILLRCVSLLFATHVPHRKILLPLARNHFHLSHSPPPPHKAMTNQIFYVSKSIKHYKRAVLVGVRRKGIFLQGIFWTSSSTDSRPGISSVMTSCT